MTQIDFSKFKDFIEVDNIDPVKSRVGKGWQLLGVSSGTYDIDNENIHIFILIRAYRKAAIARYCFST